jgi:hypothetical protein
MVIAYPQTTVWVAVMPYYRCYLLDEDGHIQSREEYESETKAAAIEAARRMLVQRPHHKAFEVWQGARRLHAEARDPLKPLAASLPFDLRSPRHLSATKPS